MVRCRFPHYVRTAAVSLIVLASTAGVPGVALASTSNDTVNTSATVQATCSIAASPLAFGTYASVQLDATTTISVTCSNAADYQIGLDAGAGPSATTSSRVMVNGAQTLNYTLYSSTGARGGGGPVLWGNTQGGRGGGSDLVAGTGTGAAQTFTVYGRVFTGQTPAPGNYTDTITATIIY